jgi:hypothetical protein
MMQSDRLIVVPLCSSECLKDNETIGERGKNLDRVATREKVSKPVPRFLVFGFRLATGSSQHLPEGVVREIARCRQWKEGGIVLGSKSGFLPTGADLMTF